MDFSHASLLEETFKTTNRKDFAYASLPEGGGKTIGFDEGSKTTQISLLPIGGYFALQTLAVRYITPFNIIITKNTDRIADNTESENVSSG